VNQKLQIVAVQLGDVTHNSKCERDLDSKLQQRRGAQLNTSRQAHAVCGAASLRIAPSRSNDCAGDFSDLCPLNNGSIPGTAQKLGWLYVLGRLMPEADRGEKGTLKKTARGSLPFQLLARNRNKGGCGSRGLLLLAALSGFPFTVLMLLHHLMSLAACFIVSFLVFGTIAGIIGWWRDR